VKPRPTKETRRSKSAESVRDQVGGCGITRFLGVELALLVADASLGGGSSAVPSCSCVAKKLADELFYMLSWRQTIPGGPKIK
jgi:hypothetical protein